MSIKANIVIEQGATYSTTVTVTDNDGDTITLDGYSANAMMKKHYTSSNSYSFTTAIDANNGLITLSMTANTTDAIPAGRYLYDLEVTDASNNVTRLLEGIVTVTPSITR